ncbi:MULTISPECIES: plasmid partitioning protein RepB C-terminal domain-containing protein [Devosia]|uniref:plasmid partitioning protein RepB C-terminal domain-containing protein n=1 Tax=Devosia TaxID=46913 RepID=UPI000CE96E7E|nr:MULTISPECIES: plasmid partitioning protein RepB C-terminal domain-containing protein [Devosia]AVF05838.1 chromosome partitioning protein ParB [Devosia sp. I507]
MASHTDGSVFSAFEKEIRSIRLSDLIPLHVVPEESKKSQRYLKVLSSVREIGLVESPIVARDKETSGKYLLLDGHVRIEVLKELGIEAVDCLIATDDEAYTYNKRISRLATVQEHYMILKAIERGVSEEAIARTLHVNIDLIRVKKGLLKGICPEAIELLKDHSVPTGTFTELRKMLAVRQVEAAQLMVAMNKFSTSYAKSLVAATQPSQLVNAQQDKRVGDLTDAQIALMEQESATLDREFRLIEESYGADNLDLVVATGYVGRLLANARVVRFLAQDYPDLLSEFQRIAEPQGVA